MSTTADIANQSLDAVGWNRWIGDLEEGTREARIILRAYSQCLRQLLRSAHWNFARRQANMVLLADASGQTANVGSNVITPWQYEYSYPIDCMKARFVPFQFPGPPSVPPGNIIPQNSQAPLTTGLGSPPQTLVRLRPARFLEATDPNFASPASADANYSQGVSPMGQTVILTNVQYAQLVYTALMPYPANWDSLFRAAFVAYLAAEIALPIWAERDRKFGMTLRAQQVQIAAGKIRQARATDGNEGWFSSDIKTDWMDFRRTGGGGYGWGSDRSGPGICFGGCDDCCGVGGTSAY